MITLLCFTYFLCITVTFNDHQGFNSRVIVAILFLMHMLNLALVLNWFCFKIVMVT
jgi:hypothetical protein